MAAADSDGSDCDGYDSDDSVIDPTYILDPGNEGKFLA